MTMDLYGLDPATDFIDGLQPTLGAASFLEMASEADISLFI
jgi:peroxiredoxin family protein